MPDSDPEDTVEEPKGEKEKDEEQEELTDVEDEEENEEGEEDEEDKEDEEEEDKPDVSWNGLHFFITYFMQTLVHFVFQLTSSLQITFLFLSIRKCVLSSCQP